jgi:hypothetical protein
VLPDDVKKRRVINKKTNIGCNYAHSFYIGGPLAALQIDQWLAEFCKATKNDWRKNGWSADLR